RWRLHPCPGERFEKETFSPVFPFKTEETMLDSSITMLTSWCAEKKIRLPCLGTPLVVEEKSKYGHCCIALWLALLDYLWGASGLGGEYVYRKQFPHGLPEQHHRRHHRSAPRRLDLFVTYRPSAGGRV